MFSPYRLDNSMVPYRQIRADFDRDSIVIYFYRPGQQFTYLGGPPSPFVNQIKMAAAVSHFIVIC